MKQSSILTIASLLSLLFLTFHLTDDIVRGMEPGGLSNLIVGVVIFFVWTLIALGARTVEPATGPDELSMPEN